MYPNIIIRNWSIYLLFPLTLLLMACSPRLSNEERIATSVAHEQAVAATLTASAPTDKLVVTTTLTEAVAVSQPTLTPLLTDIPVPTATITKIVAIPSASTPIPLDTPTNIPVPPTDTHIPTDTSTFTPIPLDTPTNIPVPPTNTPIPPTDTPIPTDTSTVTPILLDTPTNIPVPPTDTPIPPTNTPIPTDTPTFTPIPTDTPVPTDTPTFTPSPTDTLVPTATPTKIVAIPIPIEGGDVAVSTDPSNYGRNILLIGFEPSEISNPMVFRDRIGLALSIYSAKAYQRVSGAGIQEVKFQVTDVDTGDVVYERVETSSLYCLFGGDTEEECIPRTFAEMDYQWPNGQPIYNGEYRVEMLIKTDDDNGSWNSAFSIEGAQERPNLTDSNFHGTWQTNIGAIEFLQSGNDVSGTYQLYGDDQAYTISGTVSDGVLEGSYTGYGYGGGTIRFQLNQDGEQFDGSWSSLGQGQENHWCGVRSGPLWDDCGFSGFWESIGDYQVDYQPTMQLSQTGNQVEGTFFNGLQNDPGTIDGLIGTEGVGSQLTAVGQWRIGSGAGDFRWRLADLHSRQMNGRSITSDGESHQWCAWRSGLSQPSPCFE